MVARSTASGGSVVASPWIQRTRSAPGFARATASDSPAGSTPITSRPRSARSKRERPGATADVQDAPGAELVGDGEVHVEVAAVRIERVVHRRQPRVLEDRVSHSLLPSTKTATRVEAQYAVL